jgi:enoyl-[acyl-carrier protein] reductase III
VNVLSPGAIVTDAWDSIPNAKDILAIMKERTPTGRLVTPEEVALAAQFLCSTMARSIIGQTIVIDGGAGLPF